MNPCSPAARQICAINLRFRCTVVAWACLSFVLLRPHLALYRFTKTLMDQRFSPHSDLSKRTEVTCTRTRGFQDFHARLRESPPGPPEALFEPARWVPALWVPAWRSGTSVSLP